MAAPIAIDAVARQQPRHEADAADVGVAVFLREAEPLRQVRAHLVAVEDLHRRAPSSRARSASASVLLPGAGQAGEPEDEAAVRALRSARGAAGAGGAASPLALR